MPIISGLKVAAATIGNSTTDTQNFQISANNDGTMKIARKSDGSGGDILTVDAGGNVAVAIAGKVYGQTNIKGSVSQAAGVPTGAVVERGNNANGEYTKWADGTMICWSLVYAAGNVNTADGSVFTTPSTGWTYPITFTTTPSVNVTEASGVGSCWGTLGTISSSASLTSFMLKRSVGVAAVPTASLTAIGRWY